MLSQCIYIYCLRHTAAQRNSNQVRSKYKDEQISDDVRYLNKFHVKLNIWVALDAYSNAHIIALNSMFWAIMYNVYIIHVFFLAYLFLHITYIFSSSTSRFLSKMTYLPPSSPLPPSLLLPLLLIVCLGYLCLYYRCVRFFFFYYYYRTDYFHYKLRISYNRTHLCSARNFVWNDSQNIQCDIFRPVQIVHVWVMCTNQSVSQSIAQIRVVCSTLGVFKCKIDK